MRFCDVVGQEDVKRRLANSFREGRVSHAQLLVGPEGNGCLALAIAYAQFLNCTNKQEFDSCGTCPSCKKFSHLVHPDLHFVFPVINKKGADDTVSDHYITEWRKINIEKNSNFSFSNWLEFIDAEGKQGSILKGESKEIIRKLNMKTYEAEFKVMIIWLAEKMNETCANKILKILEEPPPNTVFLLVAESTDAMLATILSRSQLVKVPKIDTASLAQFVKTEFKFDDTEALAIASNANGSVVKSRELVSISETLALFFENFQVFMRNAYQFKLKEQVEWANAVGKWGREKQKSFLEYCLSMIRNNFLLNKESSSLVHLSKAELDFSAKFNPFITEDVALQFYELINESHYHVERNGSAKIIFLDTSIRISRIFYVAKMKKQ